MRISVGLRPYCTLLQSKKRIKIKRKNNNKKKIALLFFVFSSLTGFFFFSLLLLFDTCLLERRLLKIASNFVVIFKSRIAI